jgi:hypothetical protein
MKKGLLTKLAILILVMGLLVSTASAARLVVYVYDSATNKPLSGALVAVQSGSVGKTCWTASQGTCTFDIPKDRGPIYVAAGKSGYKDKSWSGKFTTYVRLGLSKIKR